MPKVFENNCTSNDCPGVPHFWWGSITGKKYQCSGSPEPTPVAKIVEQREESNND